VAIICRDYNLLFIQAPRTGCTAIARLLMERFGGEQLPANDIVDAQGFFSVPKKHCSVRQLLKNCLIPEDYASNLFTFTSVRNPYDSLASLYVKKRDKYLPYLADTKSWVYRIPGYVDDMNFCRSHSFDQWLAKHYSVGRVDRLLGRGKRSLYERYTNGAHRIMRFERLQQDFDDVMRMVGVEDDVTIPNYNATPQRRRDYQSYYTEPARRLVEYVFEGDLDRYGYSFEGLDATRAQPQAMEWPQ